MKSSGSVVGVNGNMVTVAFEGEVSMNEVAYIKTTDSRLKAEVIRIKGEECELQVLRSPRVLVSETPSSSPKNSWLWNWDLDCLPRFTMVCRIPCRTWPSNADSSFRGESTSTPWTASGNGTLPPRPKRAKRSKQEIN
jgi:hypothetical protein